MRTIRLSIDRILDAAGQKGTGKWTVIAALDGGIPLSLISESVFARCLSAQKDQRIQAAKILQGPVVEYTGDKKQFLVVLRKSALPGQDNFLRPGF